jgi:hypothetical protein
MEACPNAAAGKRCSCLCLFRGGFASSRGLWLIERRGTLFSLMRATCRKAATVYETGTAYAAAKACSASVPRSPAKQTRFAALLGSGARRM